MATPPVQVLPPSAVDFVLLANENIVANFLRGLASNLTVPTLYRRAYLLVNESDGFAVTRRDDQGV